MIGLIWYHFTRHTKYFDQLRENNYEIARIEIENFFKLTGRQEEV